MIFFSQGMLLLGSNHFFLEHTYLLTYYLLLQEVVLNYCQGYFSIFFPPRAYNHTFDHDIVAFTISSIVAVS